jgi:hypothetical protein
MQSEEDHAVRDLVVVSPLPLFSAPSPPKFPVTTNYPIFASCMQQHYPTLLKQPSCFADVRGRGNTYFLVQFYLHFMKLFAQLFLSYLRTGVLTQKKPKNAIELDPPQL